MGIYYGKSPTDEALCCELKDTNAHLQKLVHCLAHSVTCLHPLRGLEFRVLYRIVLHRVQSWCRWWFSRWVVPDSCGPRDRSLPDSSVHGISQARILKCAAISSSRDLPDPGMDLVSSTAGGFSVAEAPGKPKVRQCITFISRPGRPEAAYRQHRCSRHLTVQSTPASLMPALYWPFQVLQCLSRYCTVRLKMFMFAFYVWLCGKYYKPVTVQYYIADCVSWVPRLTLLDSWKNWTYKCALRTKFIYM